jgi:hypothetical protein
MLELGVSSYTSLHDGLTLSGRSLSVWMVRLSALGHLSSASSLLHAIDVDGVDGTNLSTQHNVPNEGQIHFVLLGSVPNLSLDAGPKPSVYCGGGMYPLRAAHHPRQFLCCRLVACEERDPFAPPSPSTGSSLKVICLSVDLSSFAIPEFTGNCLRSIASIDQ